MCLDRDDLYERAEWDGAAGTSRRQLLEKLQGEFHPSALSNMKTKRQDALTVF